MTPKIVSYETGEILGDIMAGEITVDMSAGRQGHKWYAVLEADGKPVRHIFAAWGECRKITDGQKAIFKSFLGLEEAYLFLSEPDKKYLAKYRSAIEHCGNKSTVGRKDSTAFAAADVITRGKKFPSLGETKAPRKKKKGAAGGKLHAYVDGSFNADTGCYGAGVYIEGAEKFTTQMGTLRTGIRP